MPKFDALAFFGQGIPAAAQAGVATYMGRKQQQADRDFQNEYLTMLQDHYERSRKSTDMLTQMLMKKYDVDIGMSPDGTPFYREAAPPPPPSVPGLNAPAPTLEAEAPAWSGFNTMPNIPQDRFQSILNPTPATPPRRR